MSGRILADTAELPREDPPPPPPPEPAQDPPAPPETTPPPEPRREAEDEPAAVGAAPEPAKPEPPSDWQKRLDKLTWEKYEARRQAEELQARLAEIERASRGGNGPDPVEQAKQQLRAEQAEAAFKLACNDLHQKGTTEFPDFRDAVRALNAVGYGNFQHRAPTYALTIMTAMPDGHRVYRALAADLDNAARVLALPEPLMALELSRMALGGGQASGGEVVAPPAQTPPAALSRAPEPIRPVGGTSRAGPVPLEKTSMAEFIRRRDAEEKRSRIMR